MFEIFRSVRLRRLFLSETLILVLVAALSVRLRIRWGFEPDDVPGTGTWPYWIEVFFASVTMPVSVQLALYYSGLYDRKGPMSGPALLVRLLLAHLMAGVALALLYYLVPRYRAQRLALGMCLAISSWLLFSLRHHMSEFLRTGAWRRQVLVLGTGRLGQWLGKEIMAHDNGGYELAGWLAEAPPLPGTVLRGRPVLGHLDEVAEVVRLHRVDDVVFAPDERRGCHQALMQLVEVKLAGTAVWSAQQFCEALLHCLPVELLNPSAIVFDPGFQPSRANLAIKRMFDFVVSLVALLVSLPMLLLTAIAIKLDSPGPVLYRQKRVGKGGQVFTIYKFRSMRLPGPGDAQRLTARNDDRITRVGRFIRLHRIDEFPQFFNVLLGDMSLVGPRPEVVYSVEELRKVIPYYDQRHAIRPGITSLGQVRFGAATTHEEARQRLMYDLYYQKNMSMAFDLSILIDTVKVVLLRLGAR